MIEIIAFVITIWLLISVVKDFIEIFLNKERSLDESRRRI